MNSRHGFATQISFYKDKSILGCHYDIALMHKYHCLKSRQNATFWAKVGEMGVGETSRQTGTNSLKQWDEELHVYLQNKN